MRRVGGRRRSSVSDRANALVVPAGEVTDEQAAIPDKCRGLAADSCDRPRALRPPNCCPAPSCATRTYLHRSDRANVHRAAALRQRGWPLPSLL